MAKEKKQRAEVSTDKVQARLDVISKLNKEYGKGTIMQFSDRTDDTSIQVIPTGSIGLDIALGRGGYPRGRIIEIFGPEASGKTTLTLHAIAECQKAGGVCAFIDAEHALDPEYAEKVGVDMGAVYLTQPDNGEQALTIAEELVRSNAFDLIVIDSVAALIPKSELDGEVGASSMGSQARLMSQGLRKLTGAVHTSKTVLFFINQIRMKIGVMFGNPETTTGGNALKYYSSVRLDIRKSTPIKDGDLVLGNLTNVKVVKNKVAPPFRTASFNILYGVGVDRMAELFDYAITMGLIEKAGPMYSFEGETLGKGKDAARLYVKEHPEVLEALETGVYSHYMSKSNTASVENAIFEENTEEVAE
jgi:recombination protein RecA